MAIFGSTLFQAKSETDEGGEDTQATLSRLNEMLRIDTDEEDTADEADVESVSSARAGTTTASEPPSASSAADETSRDLADRSPGVEAVWEEARSDASSPDAPIDGPSGVAAVETRSDVPSVLNPGAISAPDEPRDAGGAEPPERTISLFVESNPLPKSSVPSIDAAPGPESLFVPGDDAGTSAGSGSSRTDASPGRASELEAVAPEAEAEPRVTEAVSLDDGSTAPPTPAATTPEPAAEPEPDMLAEPGAPSDDDRVASGSAGLALPEMPVALSDGGDVPDTSVEDVPDASVDDVPEASVERRPEASASDAAEASVPTEPPAAPRAEPDAIADTAGEAEASPDRAAALFAAITEAQQQTEQRLTEAVARIRQQAEDKYTAEIAQATQAADQLVEDAAAQLQAAEQTHAEEIRAARAEVESAVASAVARVRQEMAEDHAAELRTLHEATASEQERAHAQAQAERAQLRDELERHHAADLERAREVVLKSFESLAAKVLDA